jgi:hypothetical protein
MIEVRSPYPLLRLMWRPATLLLLFPLFWAIAWPLASAADAGANPLAALRTGIGHSDAQRAIWEMGLLLGAAVALFTNLPRLEVQHSATAWSWPGLHGGLATGNLMVGAAVATLVATLLARVAPAPLAIAGGAGSLLAFSLVTLVVDSTAPSAIRWLIIGTAAAVAIRGEAVFAVASAAPWTAAAVSVAVAVLAQRSVFSPASARRRPFIFTGAAGTPSRSALADFWSRRGSDRAWWGDLATDRVGPWLRAAEYESFGALRRGYPGQYALMALVVSVLSLLALDSSILVFVGIILSSSGLQLRRTLFHPIGRDELARIAIAGAMIDAVAICGLSALVYLALAQPLAALFPQPDGARWFTTLALAFAWAPVAQWSIVRGGMLQYNRAPAEGWPRRMLEQFGSFLIFVLLVSVSRIALQRTVGDDPLTLTSGVITITVVVQALHWVTLKHHYRRADLQATR